ncbi:hypothetical protein KO561_05720 [Radiobacillus kanasensis]|nr:hypothetical protein [Radiobacillus kanasensis]UFU00440.1 hypothetical protein KO561_05720 [Radiobacillus kanasensis]
MNNRPSLGMALVPIGLSLVIFIVLNREDSFKFAKQLVGDESIFTTKKV